MKNLLLLSLCFVLAACGGSDGSSKSGSGSAPISNKTINYSAWIGEADTEVTFEEAANGYEFYRSGDASCDLANYASCTDGQMDILNLSVVTDTAFNLSKPHSYYLLKNSSEQSFASPISREKFSPRYNHQIVKFQEKLWLIGSEGGGSDVWSSVDGIAWVRHIEAIENFSNIYFRAIAFNNKLWLIGIDQIWSSIDGINWVHESTAAFSRRNFFEVAVFKNKLWLVGGLGSTFKNDVWSSEDGVTWVQETASAAFSGRYGHRMIEFNNKFWLVGGANGLDGVRADIWSSADGVSWVKVSSNSDFGWRAWHQMTVFKNRLWIIAGYGGDYASDVWSSANGINWRQESVRADFSPRINHQAFTFNNSLWVVGGDAHSARNDIWRSSDGISWSQVIAPVETEAGGRILSQSVVFNNQLWLIGGRGKSNNNDVWSTSDGIHWKLAANGGFSPRTAHQSLVFNNRLWVIGGVNDDGWLNDVWSSEDGLNWVEETADAGFGKRAGHQAVVFSNKIWVIGGEANDPVSGSFNDVWSSVDGVTWVEESPTAAFSPRSFHKVVAFDDKLWLLGGVEYLVNEEQEFGFELIHKSDAWSSDDGVTWVQQTPAAAFGQRAVHQVVVWNNKLYLIGGSNGESEVKDEMWLSPTNDVWSSDNGIDWVEEVSAAGFSPRAGHEAVVFNNRIVLFSGYDGSVLKNDVWSSIDGIVWRQGYRAGVIFP